VLRVQLRKLGLRLGVGQKGKGKEGEVEKVFSIFFKTLKPNEFKQEFEFKHSKTMHQHVCNSKLLYFII
jgi:hypothetical protein